MRAEALRNLLDTTNILARAYAEIDSGNMAMMPLVAFMQMQIDMSRLGNGGDREVRILARGEDPVLAEIFIRLGLARACELSAIRLARMLEEECSSPTDS